MTGVSVSWHDAANGALSASQTTMQSDGTATSSFGTDSSCQAGSAQATVDNQTETFTVPVVCPDLTATLTDNVGGSTSPGTPWTWTWKVANTGTGGATFPGGATVLSAALPSANVTYYSPTITGESGIVGQLNCGVNFSQDLLVCGAAGSVSVSPGGFFSVLEPAMANTAGTYRVPTPTGTCAVNPNNVVVESNESNNGCSDTVTVGQATAAVPISQGWNLIDVSLPSTTLTSLAAVVTAMNDPSQVGAGAVSAAGIYANGRFRLYVPGYSTNQPLHPTSGFFVLSKKAGTWTQAENSSYTSGQAVTLAKGWNLVAAPYPTPGLSTDTIVSQIQAQGGSAREVATYSGGSYHVYTSGGTAFTVSATSGMWIESASPSTWTPQ
jgi:hypothetical protein